MKYSSLLSFDSTRLEAVGLPNALHHRTAYAQMLGQHTCGPVGGVFGLLARCGLNDPAGRAVSHGGQSVASGRVLLDAGQPTLGKALALPPYGISAHTHFHRNILVKPSLRCKQHYLGAGHKANWCPLAPRPSLKGNPPFRSE